MGTVCGELKMKSLSVVCAVLLALLCSATYAQDQDVGHAKHQVFGASGDWIGDLSLNIQGPRFITMGSM
jgi:hypothetical protein